MKHLSVITSLLSKVEFPSRDIEAIVNHRLRKDKYRLRLNGLMQDCFLPDFENIQASSAEVPVKGNLLIISSNKSLGKKRKT